MSRQLDIPFQYWLLVAREVAVERREELLPGLVDVGLVQQAVDDERVVPVRLVAAVFIVTSNMIKVAVSAGEKPPAKPTRPCLLPSGVLDNSVGVGTGGATMGVLVVLIEGVGSPEDAVTVGTGITLVALMELVLVSLPVKLALESNITKSAPVSTLGF